jgi:hypothetical protein
MIRNIGIFTQIKSMQNFRKNDFSAHILYPNGKEPSVNYLPNKETSSVDIRGSFGYYTEEDIPALYQEITRLEKELNDRERHSNLPRNGNFRFSRSKEEIEKDIQFLKNAIKEIQKNGQSLLH